MTSPILPESIDDVNVRQWQTFQPYFDDLQQRELSAATVASWLADWSNLMAVLHEAGSWTYIEKALDTQDDEKETAFLEFINEVLPSARVAEQGLKERLLAMDLDDVELPDMTLVLRNMRSEAGMFREANVPLLTEIAKFSNEYDNITGGLAAEWEGEPQNLSQLGQHLRDKDRGVRERAWRMIMDLWQGERQALNDLFAKMLTLRQQVAANAGFADYRAYAFREYGRFDYTPADCLTFHEAIEQVVVPAAQRIYAKKQQRLGLDEMLPWDTLVDTSAEPPLRPYQSQDDLIAGSLNIFDRVDPVLGRHLATMAEENLLDLETRSGKALGGFCSSLPLRQRPFIFMNGVGIHDDVQTMLHEAGHAFHVFETQQLPLIWQHDAPMEFCEVASMAMELLAAPYLTKPNGGFYTEAEAARARIEHLEGIITFLPYMAVVDAFQHWVYTHPEAAADSAACDAVWDDLWQRFMVGIDYDGFTDVRESGWHRRLHIFQVPFYYIEYGMAQVGALQVWRNSLQDQAGAVAAYRRALALGGTRPLPELFATAGAEFRFDTAMLTDLVTLIETTIAALEAKS